MYGIGENGDDCICCWFVDVVVKGVVIYVSFVLIG